MRCANPDNADLMFAAQIFRGAKGASGSTTSGWCSWHTSAMGVLRRD